MIQTAGTLQATSSLFAGNGTADLIGKITADHSLFQNVPVIGTTITGTNNLKNVNPKLDTNGLQNNGGPTPTVALLATSPALGAGTNPLHLFTDQRGYAPRTGINGTDIGAYQRSGTADTKPPTVALQATNVTASNAASENPYTFTVTFSDNVAVAASSLAGAVVQVVPPAAVGGPITATLVNTAAIGTTDSQGDAQAFTLTFQISAPGGAWTGADNGTYTVTLGGSPVTDLAENAVALGTIGTFNVGGASLQVASFSRRLPPASPPRFDEAVQRRPPQQLYDTASAGFGPADVTLVGATTGPVQGSLILAPGNQAITLRQDRRHPRPRHLYTLTLRSASNGFQDTLGRPPRRLRQRERSGTNFTATFTVAPSTARVLAIPDFASVGPRPGRQHSRLHRLRHPPDHQRRHRRHLHQPQRHLQPQPPHHHRRQPRDRRARRGLGEHQHLDAGRGRRDFHLAHRTGIGPG